MRETITRMTDEFLSKKKAEEEVKREEALITNAQNKKEKKVEVEEEIPVDDPDPVEVEEDQNVYLLNDTRIGEGIVLPEKVVEPEPEVSEL